MNQPDRSSTSSTASASEQAYQRFLTTLSQAAEVISGPLGARDERERADGFRHLLRLASLATEQFVENGSSVHPAFTRWMAAGRKLLGDNPWTIYDSAQVNANNNYRIFGQRGRPTYLGFCIYGTKGNGDRCIVSNIDDSEIEFNDDGSFELFLSKERPAGVSNWVMLDDDASDVMVRQYFLNNDQSDKARYQIQALNVQATPAPLTEEELVRQIDRAAGFFEETINVERTISAFSEESTPVLLRNGTRYEGDEDATTIDYKWIAKAMPSPAILYTGSWVNELGDDEAVVVEGKAPQARYWSVQYLSRWMESPDYRACQVFFTQANTVLQPGGTFRVVVAHRDPGVSNWLDTTGLKSGNITVRALKSEDKELSLTFKRVKLSEIMSKKRGRG